jgi:hypothetical protein
MTELAENRPTWCKCVNFGFRDSLERPASKSKRNHSPTWVHEMFWLQNAYYFKWHFAFLSYFLLSMLRMWGERDCHCLGHLKVKARHFRTVSRIAVELHCAAYSWAQKRYLINPSKAASLLFRLNGRNEGQFALPQSPQTFMVLMGEWNGYILQNQ